MHKECPATTTTKNRTDNFLVRFNQEQTTTTIKSGKEKNANNLQKDDMRKKQNKTTAKYLIS